MLKDAPEYKELKKKDIKLIIYNNREKILKSNNVNDDNYEKKLRKKTKNKGKDIEV